MLLMVVKGIRGELCDDVHRYVKGNNIYVMMFIDM